MPTLALYAVSRELCARQLDVLRARGNETMTLSGLIDLWEVGGKGLEGGRPVAITSDDWPAALLDCTAPSMLRRGMTATFFSWQEGLADPTIGVSGTRRIFLMTAAELQGLSERSFEISSYCLNHLHLPDHPQEEAVLEMSKSRQRLQENVSQRVDFSAGPFGEYPIRYAEHCQVAGYRGTVSVLSWAQTVSADRYCMRRVLVHEEDQCPRFQFKLSRPYLWLRRYLDQRAVQARSHGWRRQLRLLYHFVEELASEEAVRIKYE